METIRIKYFTDKIEKLRYLTESQIRLILKSGRRCDIKSRRV